MGNPGWSTRSDTLGNILGHAHDRYTEHYLQAPAHGDAAYGYHTVAISYQIDNTFLPRCICSSVTSRQCIETTRRIELVFGTKAFFFLTYTLLWKFGYLQKLGYFPWNFLANFGLKQFRHSKSIASSSSTVVLLTTIDESWLFTTIRSTVTL